MRLILIRHGETAWNQQGKFQGQSPIDLNEKGLSQANRLAKAVAAMAPDSIYSSPLARTLSTARIIAEPLSKPVSTLEGLKEISLGELEGITGQEMRERYPELHEAWNAHAPSVTFPGGESLERLQDRAWACLEYLENTYQGEAVAAVTHNFAIRTILCRLLALPLAQFTQFRIDLASITVLQVDSHARQIVTMNDVSHLAGDTPIDA